MSNNINNSQSDEVFLFSTYYGDKKVTAPPFKRVSTQDILKSGNSTYHYVITEKGELVCAPQYTTASTRPTNGLPVQKVKVTHTMISGGKPVLAAGQIRKIGDEIIVNTWSDTYKIRDLCTKNGSSVSSVIEKVFKREGLKKITLKWGSSSHVPTSSTDVTVGNVKLLVPRSVQNATKVMIPGLNALRFLKGVLKNTPLMDIWFSFDREKENPYLNAIEHGTARWVLHTTFLLTAARFIPYGGLILNAGILAAEFSPDLSVAVKNFPAKEDVENEFAESNLSKADKAFLKSLVTISRWTLAGLQKTQAFFRSLNSDRIIDRWEQEEKVGELVSLLEDLEKNVLAMKALIEANSSYFQGPIQIGYFNADDRAARYVFESLPEHLQHNYLTAQQRLFPPMITVNSEKGEAIISAVQTFAINSQSESEKEVGESEEAVVIESRELINQGMQYVYANGDTESVTTDENGTVYYTYVYKNGDLKATTVDKTGKKESILIRNNGSMDYLETDDAGKERIYSTPLSNEDLDERLPPLEDRELSPSEIDADQEKALVPLDKTEKELPIALQTERTMTVFGLPSQEEIQKPTFRELMEVTDVHFGEGVLGGQGVVLTLASGAKVSLLSLVPDGTSHLSGHLFATGVTVPLDQHALTALGSGLFYTLPSAVIFLTIAYFMDKHKQGIEDRLKSDLKKEAKLEDTIQDAFRALPSFLEAYRRGEISKEAFISKANDIQNQLLAANHHLGKSGRFASQHRQDASAYFERQSTFRQTELDLQKAVKAAVLEQEIESSYVPHLQKASFQEVYAEILDLSSKGVLSYRDYLKHQAAFSELVTRLQNAHESAAALSDLRLIENLANVPAPITLTTEPIAKPTHKTKKELDLPAGKDEKRVADRVHHWADRVDYLYKEFCRIAEDYTSLEELEQAGAKVLQQINRTKGGKENQTDECDVNLKDYRLHHYYKDFIQRITFQVNWSLQRARIAESKTLSPLTPPLLDNADVGKLQVYFSIERFNRAQEILYDSSCSVEERQSAFREYIEAAKSYNEANERIAERTEREIQELIGKKIITEQESSRLAELKKEHITALVNLGRVDQLEKMRDLPNPAVLNPQTLTKPGHITSSHLISKSVGKSSAKRKTERADDWAQRVLHSYNEFCQEAAKPDVDLQELERKGKAVQDALAQTGNLGQYELVKALLNQNGESCKTVLDYYQPLVHAINQEVESTLEKARRAHQTSSESSPLIHNDELETAKKQEQEGVKNQAIINQAIKADVEHGSFQKFEEARKRHERMAEIAPLIEDLMVAVENHSRSTMNSTAKKDQKEEAKIGLSIVKKLEEKGVTEEDILAFFPSPEEGKKFFDYLKSSADNFKAIPHRREIEKGFMTYYGNPLLHSGLHLANHVFRYNGFELVKRTVTILNGGNAFFPTVLPSLVSFVYARITQAPYVASSYYRDMRWGLWQGNVINQILAILSHPRRDFQLARLENRLTLVSLANTLVQLGDQITSMAINKIFGTGSRRGRRLIGSVQYVSGGSNALATTLSAVRTIQKVGECTSCALKLFSQGVGLSGFLSQGVKVLTKFDKKAPSLSPVKGAFDFYEFLATDYSGTGFGNQVRRTIQSWIPIDLKGQCIESPLIYWFRDVFNCVSMASAAYITGGRGFASGAICDTANLAIDTLLGKHLDEALISIIKNYEYNFEARIKCAAEMRDCQDSTQLRKLEDRVARLEKAMEASLKNLRNLLNGNYLIGDSERYVVGKAKLFLFERTVFGLIDGDREDSAQFNEFIKLTQIDFKSDNKALFSASNIDIFDALHLVLARFRSVGKRASKDQEYAITQIPHELALLKDVSDYIDRRLCNLTEIEKEESSDFYEQIKSNLENYKLKLIDHYRNSYCESKFHFLRNASILEPFSLFDMLPKSARNHLDWMMLAKAVRVILSAHFEDWATLNEVCKSDNKRAKAVAKLLIVMRIALENTTKEMMESNTEKESPLPLEQQKFLYLARVEIEKIAETLTGLSFELNASEGFYPIISEASKDLEESNSTLFMHRANLLTDAVRVETLETDARTGHSDRDILAKKVQLAEMRIEKLKNKIRRLQDEGGSTRKLEKAEHRANKLEKTLSKEKAQITEKEVDATSIDGIIEDIQSTKEKVDKLKRRFLVEQSKISRQRELQRRLLESQRREWHNRRLLAEWNDLSTPKAKDNNWCLLQ